MGGEFGMFFLRFVFWDVLRVFAIISKWFRSLVFSGLAVVRF